MQIQTDDRDLVVADIPCLNLDRTFDCGQAFRWNNNNDIWEAVVQDKVRRVSQDNNTFRFFDTTPDEFQSFWIPYLDLDTDYPSILNTLKEDPTLDRMISAYPGIRILRQDPWETTISFIISANNNIPRIQGIIDRLCRNFGHPLGDGFYSFPAPEDLKDLTVEDLSVLRAGYRAKYIIDAARKVASGEIDFSYCGSISLEDAEKEIRKISGVGPKVAQCILLFGCHRLNAFPIDTWVRKVMAQYYPEGLPSQTKGFEGVAQQYLFYGIRH